ncbi:sm-like protein LSM4 isoform X1 [Zingiber officinale]|uniref:sm-like protein LSM4 isoform X1 n=1 Tax=Zingiber officinale TaxID=94328 RepID=UPI001C4B84D8|nr:sm-like protein LSM4 isoform X1 [Zingiber officinale]
MLVELKNGETYNGHLVNCDTWMNIHLREVICTSKDGDRFWRMPECYIRGNTIKYLRVPDEVIDKVQEETTKSRTEMAYIGKPMKVTANARNSCNVALASPFPGRMLKILEECFLKKADSEGFCISSCHYRRLALCYLDSSCYTLLCMCIRA